MMNQRWSAPSGWPIVDEGLIMAGIEDVMIVRLETKITEAAFNRHLDELGRAIDGRRLETRIGVLYDSLGGVDADAQRRQRVAGLLSARREKRAATTAGFTLVTGSPAMRGVLRAVFFVAPPPYPWAITASLLEGLAYLRTQMPKLEVDRTLREYERIKAHAARHATSAQPFGETSGMTSGVTSGVSSVRKVS